MDPRPVLDTQQPYPLFGEDTPTDLGLLPSDDLVRRDRKFEVIVLGVARPHRPTTQHTVSLTVGSISQSIRVFGDRVWSKTMGALSMSAPQPFTEMPLTWERAFGGTAEVWLDRHSPIDISDPLNGRGRGFDPAPRAAGFADWIGVPPGFPVIRGERKLPNLEDPSCLISRPSDAPRPMCWATRPSDVGFSMVGTFDRARSGDVPKSHMAMEEEAFQRGHPNWLLEQPPAGTRVELRGVSGEPVVFTLPDVHVVGDYAVGDKRGHIPLVPHTLVLLPEDKKFYVVHRMLVKLPDPSGTDRSIRLRLVKGWSPR